MKKLVVTVLNQNGATEIPAEEYVESTKKNIGLFKAASILKEGEYGYDPNKVEYLDQSGCVTNVENLVYAEEYDGVIAMILKSGTLYAEAVHITTDIESEKSSVYYSRIYEKGSKHIIPCRDKIVIVEAIDMEQNETETPEFEKEA